MKFADQLEIDLPFLRRYAWTLSGTQDIGDQLAYETLEAITQDRSAIDTSRSVRAGLYQVFHRIWVDAGRMINAPSSAAEHLSGVQTDSREAFLLSALEGFSVEEIGFILGRTDEHFAQLLQDSTLHLQGSGPRRIVIIEDEHLIVADLTKLLEEAGHTVVGSAATHSEAIVVATEQEPDMILADIELADGSSGIDAVQEILSATAVPVLFVTAFPERLLTGSRPEPAFLITKPYNGADIKAAVSQAMFFAQTETLPDPTA